MSAPSGAPVTSSCGEVALDEGLPAVFDRLLDPAGDALKVVIDVGSSAA